MSNGEMPEYLGMKVIVGSLVIIALLSLIIFFVKIYWLDLILAVIDGGLFLMLLFRVLYELQRRELRWRKSRDNI